MALSCKYVIHVPTMEIEEIENAELATEIAFETTLKNKDIKTKLYAVLEHVLEEFL